MNNYQHKWDEIAVVWDLFENKGMNINILNQYLHHFVDPIMIIGSGRGTTLKPLVNKFGTENVWGVDGSRKMVEIARKSGYSNILITDDLLNPLKTIKNRFKTIIIATGVIEPLVGYNRRRLLRNLLYSLDDNGKIFATVFAKETKRYQIAKSISATNKKGILLKKMFSLAYEINTKNENNLNLNIEQKMALYNMFRVLKKIAVQNEITLEKAKDYLLNIFADVDVLVSDREIRKLFFDISTISKNCSIIQSNDLHIVLATKSADDRKDYA